MYLPEMVELRAPDNKLKKSGSGFVAMPKLAHGNEETTRSPEDDRGRARCTWRKNKAASSFSLATALGFVYKPVMTIHHEEISRDEEATFWMLALLWLIIFVALLACFTYQHGVFGFVATLVPAFLIAGVATVAAGAISEIAYRGFRGIIRFCGGSD